MKRKVQERTLLKEIMIKQSRGKKVCLIILKNKLNRKKLSKTILQVNN